MQNDMNKFFIVVKSVITQLVRKGSSSDIWYNILTRKPTGVMNAERSTNITIH